MNLVFRAGRASDASACGAICYEAFKAISDKHNFPTDFPNPEAAIELMDYVFTDKNIYSVVAEVDGQIVGSNFLWLHAPIAGVGPITVDPNVQNAAIGRRLMEEVLQRADELKMSAVRLAQAAYHNRSLALYMKLGFDVKEPLSVMQGNALALSLPGYEVRAATLSDLQVCNELCFRIHGHDRLLELRGAINAGNASVVEHLGKITGYTAQLGFFGHTVAETNNDLKALIGAAKKIAGPGFLLPSRNSELMRWCLGNGLKVVQPMTLMSRGLYNEPTGAFLPSVIY